MDSEKWWNTFEQTGKIEDYLRYCGIDIHASGTATVAEDTTQEAPYERYHRRPDSARKQQYR